MFWVYRCTMHTNCTIVENKDSKMRTHYDVLPEDHHPVPEKDKK